MTYSANLIQELHAAPVKQLLSHLFPPQAASRLSEKYNCIHETLFLSSPEELAALSGVGSKSIRKILAFRELSHRIDVERSSQIKSFHHPKDIFNYLCDMRSLQQEQFRVILLNTKNRIICQKLISQGAINASFVSPREVFHFATKHLSASIIIAHNHPSGDCKPSEQDLLVTETLVSSGKLLEIPVLDHVIIGYDNYFSFYENGILPK